MTSRPMRPRAPAALFAAAVSLCLVRQSARADGSVAYKF